ncbi:unnamed protein product [Symbiodinium necroappetens]|uniref:Uncharacterized protein n=1 Tax=Symbiodinium necroappetens TaxID=1628268 RepID=A0A812Q5Y1_9DINO|nr:unnamed protein product [Symbiodinium necroappetens]
MEEWTVASIVLAAVLGLVCLCCQLMCCCVCTLIAVQEEDMTKDDREFLVQSRRQAQERAAQNTPWAFDHQLDQPQQADVCFSCGTTSKGKKNVEGLSQVLESAAAAQQEVWTIATEEIRKKMHQEVGRKLRCEMRLMWLLPLLPLVAAPWTTCAGGSPTWVYLLYIPALLRAKYIEYQLLQQLEALSVKVDNTVPWSLKLIFEFCIGAFEHFDWFTDGAMPVQAAVCDPKATDVWATTFEASWFPIWVPLIRGLHFWGVLVIALVSAGMAQQFAATVCVYRSDVNDNTIAADAAGLGSIAFWYERASERDATTQFQAPTRRSLATCLSKVIMENLVQLFLQASLYGIIFDDLDRSGHWKVLASMFVGLAMALYKLLPVLRFFALAWTGECCRGEVCKRGCSGLFCLLLLTVAYLSGLVFIAWIIAKIYFAFTCPDHLWGLTTGCVFMNSTDHARSHHVDLWPF